VRRRIGIFLLRGCIECIVHHWIDQQLVNRPPRAIITPLHCCHRSEIAARAFATNCHTIWIAVDLRLESMDAKLAKIEGPRIGTLIAEEL
jgi:hypothetical protein